MFAYFRNCSLFKQLIVPMVVVGIIGAVAIIASAFVLQYSVKALGEMYSASGERLKTLQDIDKGIANVRALSLKHLASESAQDMQPDQNRSGAWSNGSNPICRPFPCTRYPGIVRNKTGMPLF